MSIAQIARYSITVQALLARIVDDINAKKSLFVLLPYGIRASDVSELLIAEPMWRTYDIRDAHAVARCPPVEVLCEAFGQKPDSLKTLLSTIARDALPHALFIDGDSLDVATTEQWVGCVEAWSSLQRRRSSEAETSLPLCVFLPAMQTAAITLPANDIAIATHYWWGIPSLSENRVHCTTRNEASKLHQLWCQAIVPALASHDLTLADVLAERLFGSVGDLHVALIELANERGWTAEWLLRHGASQELIAGYEIHANAPPDKQHTLRRLWAEGALQYSEEYGLELHPAAASVLPNGKIIVCQRVWRGQLHVIFPYLNRLRLLLCAELSRDYGKDWLLRKVPLDMLKRHHLEADDKARDRAANDPMGCDFRPILYALGESPAHRARDPYLLAQDAQELRNTLAHYGPLDYAQFADFWERAQRYQRVSR